MKLNTGRLGRALGIMIAFAGPATAGPNWSTYANGRFEYRVDLPPGFAQFFTPENGDGGRWRGNPGHAVLSIWGAYLVDETFEADVRSRIGTFTSEGWSTGYKALSGRAASWSGAKGDRIRYARGITRCGDRMAYFQIEYDSAAKKRLDPIVSRLARSLSWVGRC